MRLSPPLWHTSHPVITTTSSQLIAQVCTFSRFLFSFQKAAKRKKTESEDESSTKDAPIQKKTRGWTRAQDNGVFLFFKYLLPVCVNIRADDISTMVIFPQEKQTESEKIQKRPLEQENPRVGKKTPPEWSWWSPALRHLLNQPSPPEAELRRAGPRCASALLFLLFLQR